MPNTKNTAGFADFGLPEKLLHTLQRLDFNTPTPVQMQAIPVALTGADILASAQTGTGKTAAFGIPLIAHMMEDRDASAIILAPTRELATQINTALLQMIPVPYIKTALLIGGESMPKQLKQLAFRPRLIIGTPGRVNDHLERRSLDLRNASYLVLDETDRMLDMGFGVQIDRILKHMPSKRQTMMFSATIAPGIAKLSEKYMHKPQRITVGTNNTPIAKIDQETVQVKDGDKYDQLLAQIEKRDGSIIIFVKTKHGTQRMSDKLNREGLAADAIHGDLQQRRRDRVIQTFRDKQFRILVATDVAARGLDIPHIEHVINYDLPQSPEDYIHRIGRTGRAGATGSAVSFLTNADKLKWNAIQRLIGGKVDDSVSHAAPKSKKPFENRRFANKKPFAKKTFDKPNEGRWNSEDRPRTGEAAKPFAKKSFKKPTEDRWNKEERPRTGEAAKPFAKKPFKKPSEGRWNKEERPRTGEPAKPFAKKPFGPKKFGSKTDARGGKPFNRSAKPASKKAAY